MLASTSLNVASVFLFSTVMLYQFSGEDMVRIQEQSIDEVRNDFQVMLGAINSQISPYVRKSLIKTIKGQYIDNAATEAKRKRANYKLRNTAIVVTLSIFVVSIILYLKYPPGKVTISDFFFTTIVTLGLLATEVYVYFEIIRNYKYNTKERFYTKLFDRLLKGVSREQIENNLCQR